MKFALLPLLSFIKIIISLSINFNQLKCVVKDTSYPWDVYNTCMRSRETAHWN